MNMTTSVYSSLPPPPREPPSWARPSAVYPIACGTMILVSIIIALQLTRDTLDTVVPLFFCLCLSVMFLFMARRDRERRRLLAVGEVARGVVKDSWASRGAATITYEYSVDRVSYSGRFPIQKMLIKRIFGAPVREGDEVLVVFDPNQHTRSTLWGKT